jgi:hypothetical protein
MAKMKPRPRPAMVNDDGMKKAGLSPLFSIAR